MIPPASTALLGSRRESRRTDVPVLDCSEKDILKPKMIVYLARPRGFCAGVDRAIDIVKFAMAQFSPPVYVRHEIVHNHHVVSDLRERGAVFVDDLTEIPEGSVTVFSAHGVAPEVRAQAKARRLRVIDATCPLVTKVHLEAIRYAKQGFHIILIGHRNHVEVEGTMGEAPNHITLVETMEDIERLEISDPDRVAVVTQTTLSVDDAAIMLQALRDKYPNIRQPKAHDICYATTNRQAAVREMAKFCQAILVIGSPTSSNSNRLVEVALSKGIRSYLVDDASEISPDMLMGVEKLGITAGASAPELIVQSILARLRKSYNITSLEEVAVGSEEVAFSFDKQKINMALDSGATSTTD